MESEFSFVETVLAKQKQHGRTARAWQREASSQQSCGASLSSPWEHRNAFLEAWGCCSVPKKGILCVHTEQKRIILSFLASLWIMSHRWAITCGESRDAVQPLCRCPAWAPESTAVVDVLGRRIYEKSPSLAVIQLPVTWLGFCWWQRLHAYCKYLYSTETGASPLGYTQTFMGTHIKRLFPTPPRSWLVFLTCLPPN